MTALTPEQVAEARRLYALRMTPHRVTEAMNRFGRNNVTREQVRAVLDLRVEGRQIDPELRRRIVELRATGMRRDDIAALLGTNFRTVKTVCSYVRITTAASPLSERERATRREQARKRRQIVAMRKRQLLPVPKRIEVEVPGWVREHLHEFYEHHALRHGEQAAASVTRRLQRGGSLACP